MELQDLVMNKGELSGVDFNVLKVKGYFDKLQDAQSLSFILNDKTYTAIEDPDDGYKSTMSEIIEDNAIIKNKFGPIDVYSKFNELEKGSEILEIYDAETNEIILEVGTNYEDSYYPEFIYAFYPENMYINLGK